MPSFSTLLAHLRFTLITATLLMVLGLNHQAVATIRVAPAGRTAHVNTASRTSVVKQRVTLEATSPLSFFVAPAVDAWFPGPIEFLFVQWHAVRITESLPCQRTLPVLLSSRLLLASLSPQAP